MLDIDKEEFRLIVGMCTIAFFIMLYVSGNFAFPTIVMIEVAAILCVIYWVRDRVNDKIRYGRWRF